MNQWCTCLRNLVPAGWLRTQLPVRKGRWGEPVVTEAAIASDYRKLLELKDPAITPSAFRSVHVPVPVGRSKFKVPVGGFYRIFWRPFLVESMYLSEPATCN